MNRNTCMLLVMLCLCGIASAQKLASSGYDPKQLAIKWELIENNYRKQPQFLSALTITNTGAMQLPAKGWAIYFSIIQELRPLPATGNMKLEHVNGDIFRLIPAAGFAGIAPNQSVRVEYVCGDDALNVTDAPGGPYLVWDDQPTTGISIANYTVTPIKDTSAGAITPARLYNQNWYTHDIPASELPGIFPTPIQYKETGGEWTLTAAVQIVAGDDSLRQEGEYLAARLGEIFGRKPEVVSLAVGAAAGKTTSGRATSGKTALGRTVIRLTKLNADTLSAEGYLLESSPEGMTISATAAAGIFYGIQSLISMLPGSAWQTHPTSIRLPKVSVQDAPRFGFRGFSLDIGRNFQQKKEVLKLLDLMALYKLNALHLHFSEDEGWRIEIPSLPELTQIGSRRGHTPDSKAFLPASFGDGPDPDHSYGSGYYTKDEYIGILQYATVRHIEVIPEIETPGHARAAIKAMDARYERFMKTGQQEEAERYLLRDIHDSSRYSSNQLWTDNVMCPALPSTYRFLERVMDDLIAMYKEAGAPLHTIHVGGDEVPAGVWEKSPVCLDLIRKDPTLHSVNDLWYYYFGKVNDLLVARGLFLSGWEEITMRKTMLDGSKQLIPNPGFTDKHFRAHVWNNMIGGGYDDLPYRLANAGYTVVLSPVNNLYFDMAYNRSPAEPGYYWGGYTDLDKPFYFIPYDYYKNSKEDKRGNPIDPVIAFLGKDRLTEYGKTNIAGIEGLIWSENIHGPERLEYMLLPKFLGMAERAWASDPEWATEKDPQKSRQLYDQAWSRFVNIVGKRELPRLDYYAGGFNYHIPQPGISPEDGKLKANIQIPGLTLRYTTDASEPTIKSALYTGPLPAKGKIRIKAFDGRGRSGMESEWSE
jgi:hexosaminidase